MPQTCIADLRGGGLLPRGTIGAATVTSRVRFPARRRDGSFTIHARFSTQDTSVLPRIAPFLDEWMCTHQIWPTLSPGAILDDQLELTQAFAAPPRVVLDDDGLRFTIVLEGRAASMRWKDWLVQLTTDLEAAFPDVRHDDFISPASEDR